MNKHIVIIGGGMAGTSAAYYLTERGYDVTVVEKNAYLGGRIKSIESDGATFEMGAGFMTNAYTNILSFIQENNLESKRCSLKGRSGILRGSKVKLATAGNLVGNDTLSWGAKIQALPLLCKVLLHWGQLDVHHPLRAKALDARTVDELFKGKSGAEFLEYVMQPILNGYFYWSPEETNEAIASMITKALMQGGTYRLEGGLKQLPAAAAHGAQVMLNCEVGNVSKLGGGKYEITYENSDGATDTLQADGIVCATTATVAIRIISNLTKRQRLFLESVRYSSTALMAQVYEQSQIKGDQGIAFPRKEGYRLAAVTASPDPGQDNKHMATVKAYVSGAYFKELNALKDEIMVESLTREFSIVRDTVVESNATPRSIHTQRWPEALPIFDRGYYSRLQSFMDDTSSCEGLVFAGDYIGGPLMEGAFTSGVQAAEKLDEYLSYNEDTL